LSSTSWGFVPIIALIAGILLEGALARLLSARAKGWLAFSSSLVALGGVFALWSITQQGKIIELNLLKWDGPIALAYHIDGLSQFFALMAVGIGTAVLLYSIGYMAKDKSVTRFYILMLIFIAGLVHLVYSADFFLIYLSWEVIGLCSFLLVGFWYQQKEAAAGARKVLVMTHIAGYGLLASILILFAWTGTTLWTDPKIATAFNTGIFLLMVLAAFAKSVQFPLHTWIPDAMAAPTPVSSLLHAACYVKAGVYLIARLHSLGLWATSWQNLVIWVGTITLLVGGLFAMIQSDLKRLLAFSTVSQIGYMMLALGLSTPLGIAAGLLHCLNHGLFKGELFLCAGSIQHVTGTRNMDLLGGLGRHMPKTTFLWLIGAGSIAGVPLLSGFVSKWLIYNAALEAGYIVPALISWIVSVITVFYFLKATTGVFFGNESAYAEKSHEASKTMIAGAAILGAGSVILGVAPQLAVRYVINPLLPNLGVKPVIGVSWLGLTAGTGSWFTTAGLILVILSVGIGVLVYWISKPARRKKLAFQQSSNGVNQTFTGGEPLAEPAILPASDFSLIVKTSLRSFYKWADPDHYYLGLWKALLRVANILGKISGWLEKNVILAILLTALLAAGLLALLIPGGENNINHVIHSVQWQVMLGIGIALLALILSSSGAVKTRSHLMFIIVSGLLALLGLGIDQSLIRLLTLEGAALVVLILVWKTSQEKVAGRVYMLTVILSAVAMITGTLLLEAGHSSLVLPLLLTGFAIKLALVPLYLWLPLVAEKTPASVIGLVVAVVDVAAFGELLMLRETSSWLFTAAAPWLTVALLSALGGAALMLAQKDLKRFLAFSTIEDMGYLILGVTIGGKLGLTGAAIGATVHALAKALLFSSLTRIEADEEPLTLNTSGLASRYPLSGAGFLIGTLAMLGIPPTLGYTARWRLYGAANQAGFVFMVVLLGATALAVLAYARVIALYWWGPGKEKKQYEPVPLVLAVVGLSIILLIFGFYPGVFTG